MMRSAFCHTMNDTMKHNMKHTMNHTKRNAMRNTVGNNVRNTLENTIKHKRAIAIAIGTTTLLATGTFAAEADNAAYREGYGLVLEQRWDEARTYFEQFKNDHPGSGWADDAAFWQCYAIEQVTN